jgi:pyruvate dehydrogenase E1 component
MENFRRELAAGGGLSSYPHPYLMPDFWQFPTVSMGLSPIMAIYQARFNRYMEDRGIKPPDDRRVWAFLGDGETDEPETLGAITLAAREQLDNLIFVINCNLQRLDGPVRGNGKIIQELEAAFRGAGWNAIKVIWGAMTGTRCWPRTIRGCWSNGWRRCPTASTRSTRWPAAIIFAGFFRRYPQLEKHGRRLHRRAAAEASPGRPRPPKVYAAYQAAVSHQGCPHGHSGQDHQGLRPGGGGRVAMSPTSRKSSTKRSCVISEAASAFPSLTTRSRTPPFTGPTTTAKRSAT